MTLTRESISGSLVVGAIILACGRGDTHRADSAKAAVAGSPLVASLPGNVRETLDSIRESIRQDTTSPASKQLNLMTAPVDILPLSAFESDTLQWVARADSCAMVVRSFGPTGSKDGFGGGWTSVDEASGTIGPGRSMAVSPSPDWSRLAYTRTLRLPSDSTRWKDALHEVRLSFGDVGRVAEPWADGSLLVRFAVIEPDPEGCMGEGCSTPLVSPIHGGWRIAWTADSRYLLVAKRGDSLRWTVIDPITRQPVATNAQTPHQLKWATRSVAAAIDPAPVTDITGGGPYRFTRRGDSILVRGPDRNGRSVDRVVGAGVPVAVTRNGQYLLAVRRENDRARAVVYAFRLFHAMMRTSCDRAQ